MLCERSARELHTQACVRCMQQIPKKSHHRRKWVLLCNPTTIKITSIFSDIARYSPFYHHHPCAPKALSRLQRCGSFRFVSSVVLPVRRRGPVLLPSPARLWIVLFLHGKRSSSSPAGRSIGMTKSSWTAVLHDCREEKNTNAERNPCPTGER